MPNPPLEINSSDDLQRLCCQVHQEAWERIRAATKDAPLIGGGRMEHKYHPTYDELRSAFLAAGVAQSVALMMTSRPGEFPETRPSPGDILSFLREATRHYENVARGLEPGATYKITVERRK